MAVYEFSNTPGLHHKFPLRVEGWDRLTVTNTYSQVLVLSDSSVAVYDINGLFVRSFGEETLKEASDITAGNDGSVMVVEWDDSCVHIFSEDGVHLNKFELQGRYWYMYLRTAFQHASEHVVIACMENMLVSPQSAGLRHVEIFTKDGDFVRSTQIHEERIRDIQGMTVTMHMDGRIAVLLKDTDRKYKVLVI